MLLWPKIIQKFLLHHKQIYILNLSLFRISGAPNHQGFEEQEFNTPATPALNFLNKKDASGLTPLKIALKSHHIKNALILIDSGANISIL